jgi:hypothetical protein
VRLIPIQFGIFLPFANRVNLPGASEVILRVLNDLKFNGEAVETVTVVGRGIV